MKTETSRRHIIAAGAAAIGATAVAAPVAMATHGQEASQARPGEQIGKVVEQIPPPMQDAGKARDKAARAVGVPAHVMPGAASMPADERENLLNAYHCWLDNERRWLAWERAGRDKEKFHDYLHWVIYQGHNANAFHPSERPASSRALVVLSAVGCDWRESEETQS